MDVYGFSWKINIIRNDMSDSLREIDIYVM